MSIILVRHGETPLNLTRMLQLADTPPSAKGLAQAQAVARRLAGMKLAGIVSAAYEAELGGRKRSRPQAPKQAYLLLYGKQASRN